MEELCAKSAEDDEQLLWKLKCFMTDRSIDSVTGIRRMGRINLVHFFKNLCDEKGVECSIYPDISSGTIILLEHWTGIESIAESIESTVGPRDIIFGQDLCHQVPALVRFERK